VVEFAMTLPIFLALLGGIVEYAWLFFLRAQTVTSVRDGCRSGSLVLQDDPGSSDHPAIEAARTSITDDLSWFNMECSDSDSDCSIEVSLSGSRPSEALECAATLPYTPIMGGLIPTVDAVSARSMARLEVQQ
jgi:Flp pilus assembly protein TadG